MNKYILTTVIFFALFYINDIQSQNTIKTSLGVGFSNLLHVGVQQRSPKFQYGISIGTFPYKAAKLLSFNSNLSYYYGKFSRHTNLKEYFIRIGGGYFRNENQFSIENTTFVKFSLGMEINVSKKIGIEFGYGVSRRLHTKSLNKSSYSYTSIGFDFPKWIVLDLNLNMFYRF